MTYVWPLKKRFETFRLVGRSKYKYVYLKTNLRWKGCGNKLPIPKNIGQIWIEQ